MGIAGTSGGAAWGPRGVLRRGAGRQAPRTVKTDAARGAPEEKPEETKQEGKYLVELLPVNPSGPGRQQRIGLALGCVDAAGNAGRCRGNPPYPLVLGTSFAILASSDQGLPVTLRILGAPGGAAASASAGHPNVYIPTAPGKLVFEAAQGGVAGAAGGIAPAPTMTLTLDVEAQPRRTPPECAAFTIPRAEQETPRLEAAAIVKLLGDPAPFMLEAQGKNAIALYSKRAPQAKSDPVLADIRAKIAALAAMSPEQLGIAPPTEPFNVEIAVPHAAALGDLANRVAALGYSKLAAESVGPDKIRITAPARPDCEEWRSFLADLRHVVWQLHPEPSSVRLFYLNAPDAGAALNAGGSAAAAGGGAAPRASSAAGVPVSPAAGPGAAAAAANTPAGSAPAAGAAAVPARPAGRDPRHRRQPPPRPVARRPRAPYLLPAAQPQAREYP